MSDRARERERQRERERERERETARRRARERMKETVELFTNLSTRGLPACGRAAFQRARATEFHSDCGFFL